MGLKNKDYLRCYDALIENENIDEFHQELIQSLTTSQYKIHVLKNYLYYVNQKKINITDQQMNISFQDIIYNKYNQWQVGYSGTTSIELNNYIQ